MEEGSQGAPDPCLGGQAEWPPWSQREALRGTEGRGRGSRRPLTATSGKTRRGRGRAAGRACPGGSWVGPVLGKAAEKCAEPRMHLPAGDAVPARGERVARAGGWG